MMRATALLFAVAALLAAQPKKIVIVGFSPEEVRELQSASPDVKIVPVNTRGRAVTSIAPDAAAADLIREVADADAFIGGPTRDVILAAKRLKWVQIPSAGVERYRIAELIRSDIVMTNYRTIASPGIADHAIGMLLALTRKLNYFIEARAKEDWQRRSYGLLELQGKTAVIIGIGGIGSHIAKRAHAFGMEVIGVDAKELPPTPFASRIVYPDRLNAVLPLADIVFVSAPQTPESEAMFGASQFELMKRGSYFIAVSRGKLYDLNALVAALDSRKLAGAGVDVTEPEPLPKGHPLWKFQNVIITPHIATQSDGEQPRQMELLKENIARFARGERLRNVVDKVKGY